MVLDTPKATVVFLIREPWHGCSRSMFGSLIS